MPKDTETGSGRVHSCYGLRRTRWRWIGRTSTLGDAIRTHSGLFTKLRDMTATRCDTPCMTSHTQANALNGDIRNRGPIFLQTWKARSNALNPIVEATLRVQLPAISRTAMAWVGTRQRPSNELASLISSRRGVRQCAETGASKGQEETLQSSRLAMDALARVHIFDLDNSGAPPAHSVDGVHAEPAVANEP